MRYDPMRAGLGIAALAAVASGLNIAAPAPRWSKPKAKTKVCKPKRRTKGSSHAKQRSKRGGNHAR